VDLFFVASRHNAPADTEVDWVTRKGQSRFSDGQIRVATIVFGELISLVVELFVERKLIEPKAPLLHQVPGDMVEGGRGKKIREVDDRGDQVPVGHERLTDTPEA